MAGLRFFPPKTPATEQRRRWLFAAVFLAATISLIWPGYELVAHSTLGGWPLALLWNVWWLVVILVSLGMLYSKDR